MMSLVRGSVKNINFFDQWITLNIEGPAGGTIALKLTTITSLQNLEPNTELCSQSVCIGTINGDIAGITMRKSHIKMLLNILTGSCVVENEKTPYSDTVEYFNHPKIEIRGEKISPKTDKQKKNTVLNEILEGDAI